MLRHPLVRVLVLVALLVGLPLWWVTVALTAGPTDGTETFANLGDFSRDGIVVTEMHDPVASPPNGHDLRDPHLRTGDVVIDVDGRSIDYTRVAELQGTRAIGDVVTYTVRRGETELDVDVPLRRYDIVQAARRNLGTLVPLLVVVALAGSIAFHRPGDWAARALIAVVLCFEIGVISWPFNAWVIDLAGGRGLWPIVVGEIAFALFWATLALCPLLFPRPARRLERRPVWALAVLGLPFVLYAAALVLAPDDPATELALRIRVSFVAAKILPLLIVAATITAYRRAHTPEERRPLQLVLWASGLGCATYLTLFQVPALVLGEPLVDEVWAMVVFVPCMLAIGTGVLQYRVFDVLLRRGLLYGMVTAVLVTVFVASGEVLSRLMTGRVGDDRAAWIVAGAVSVVWFPWLRNTLRELLSPVIFGARDDPDEVLTRLSQQLETTEDPTQLLPAMAATVARVLRLPFVAIELTDHDSEVRTVVQQGRPMGRTIDIPLVHVGHQLGRLRLDVDAPLEQFSRYDRRLLEGLGRQFGAAARLVLLNAAHQRSLERLVTTREEDRQRIAHELHDGIGPTIGAGVIQLGLVHDLIRVDPAGAEDRVTQVIAAAQEVVVEVRRIVDDLRPPVLDELGLVGAIQQRATYFVLHEPDGGYRTLDITVDARLDGITLPLAVELNVYRVVHEALNNAVRHGHAPTALVTLEVIDNQLVVDVTDTGSGLPKHPKAGVGLNSMNDRARELGGTCEVRPARRGGTTVRLSVPLT